MRVLAERYELGEQLGAGGMARVVRAHDTLLDRPVAVKLLTDAPDDDARRRFLREARTSARLRHPSAVAVYDTGEEADQPYIVMELIEGPSLADLLRDRGPLDVEEAIGITASVLDALAAAHATGMIHRDVKPANVLLPDEGGVKLSDFGIAKAMDDASEGLTATGSVLGTPSYLAPELIDGTQASPASDLYSVGCLLYAQLAGHPPFRGAPLAVAYAHRHEPVPPIAAERPDLPDDLLAVLARALEKDPERRFVDAASMRAALLGGPMGEPTGGPSDGGPTAAMAVPGSATPGTDGAGTGARRTGNTDVGGPREATQVLHGGSSRDDAAEATRATGTGIAAGSRGRGTGRGTRSGRLVALLVALLAVALVVWLVLDREGTDGLDDDTGDGVQDVEDVEEPDGAPDEPVDDPPDTADQAPEDAPDDTEDAPDPEDPGTEGTTPPSDDTPADDTEPPGDDPGDDTGGDDTGGDDTGDDTGGGDGDDTATPPGQDDPGGGPSDGTPGQGTAEDP